MHLHIINKIDQRRIKEKGNERAWTTRLAGQENKTVCGEIKKKHTTANQETMRHK